MTAIALLPLFVLGAAVWHSWRNRSPDGTRGPFTFLGRVAEQVRLYVASGVMPATYYIFALYERPTTENARSFLKRAETKGLLYGVLRQHMPPSTNLNDKAEFAMWCARAGLPHVPTLAVIRGPHVDPKFRLPRQDLFVKPLNGKGGKGAECWSYLGDAYRSSLSGLLLGELWLIQHLARRAGSRPLLIQPLVWPAASMADLTCGALSTFRLLTCLDEDDRPEIVGAVLRMGAHSCSIVDNAHQGGLIAAADLVSGRLGPLTDMGVSRRIGWLDRHPMTGSRINGRVIEEWEEIRALALRAHQSCQDRLLVGWDIALSDDGPILVEANSSPDLDIIQRATRTGLADGRFAQLLAARFDRWRNGLTVKR